MKEEERIKAGVFFYPYDPELKAIKCRTHKLNQDFNALYEDEVEKRSEILHEMLGDIGEDTYIQGPVTFHYGVHTHIGSHVFINFNFTVQDDAEVFIGDHCDFGPNVTIVTPMHPMIAQERVALECRDGVGRRLCWGKPVHIGNNCWFGANAVICPGVTIGDNCVIGAGSVVTRSIPTGSFAAGNPCRVIREITQSDSVRNKPEIWGDYFA